MSGSNYDNPIHGTYLFPAAAIDTAAVIGRLAGPAGKTGRLVGVSTVITVATTVAASQLNIGSASDADAYGTQAIAITAIDGVITAYTDLTSDDNLITADTAVELSSDGGATAGDGDITLYIDWF